MEVHHVLPQKFAREFQEAGIDNIHDPRFGSWVGKGPHRGWSYQYNQDWREFFDLFKRQGIKPTQEQILEFARTLAKEYEFDVIF